ncbi:GNAT family N-acetyltransferase [Actinokineospora sp. PR83]|uniref:GNAT family N-acetyltransferase n=1 Tax=Actinokineospora sp. PR83 TaxID=2884908 RepID=UPI0027E1C3CF|nr:GNAT family N-acetyltransferase [Actinokineospora sp. PR83]MCG8918557.1 GNAT family N-acetyltransferase [Actinokineospora sp. PR83]
MIDSWTSVAGSRTRRVVAEWVWGWALSRGVPDPVVEPDGYRIDVGLPGHRVRYVLPDPGSVGPRAADLTEPGTWLKVCGSPEQVRPGLGSRWTTGAAEYLMSTGLGAHPPITPPDPYTVELRGTGDVHNVVVRTADGGCAAKGQVAVRGRAAVVDMVETDPAHRRRGLGSVVMTELSRVASTRGAVRAVLVATEAGLALYRGLGWVVESPITAAHLAA